MNKKFFVGLVAGVTIGFGAGAALPLFSATDIDIKVPASRTKTNKSKQQKSPVKKAPGDTDKEVVEILKEINKNIKNGSAVMIEQNNKIIKGINDLNEKSSPFSG